MAKAPKNLVLRHLRQIQRTLADHTRRFDRIEQKLDRILDKMAVMIRNTKRIKQL